MGSVDTIVVLAGRYDSERAAKAGFDSVRNFYKVSGMVDTYDAAVIHREHDVTRGMSRKDLKDIGEFLDKGESSLIVVAGSDVEDRVLGLMAAADETTREQIDADLDKLDAEIAAAVDTTANAK
jgi:hypothetical protein